MLHNLHNHMSTYAVVNLLMVMPAWEASGESLHLGRYVRAYGIRHEGGWQTVGAE